MIPQFSQHGMLPAGVHDCTLAEIRDVLGFNDHRLQLLDSLESFLDRYIRPFQGLNECPIYIDGSFVRQKPLPKDIDFVLDASAINDEPTLQKLLFMRFGNEAIKAEFNVDFWYKHPTLPNDLTAYFQYAGVSVAAELSISAKAAKGILRTTT